MAAQRHNLSRRALLGVGVGACAVGGRGRGAAVPIAPAFEPARSRAGRAWERAVTIWRRAEARVAAFEAEERLLPAKRRALAADALEARFEQLDKLRLAAVRRLLRLPAADLPALVLKLDLAIAEQAWEDSGSEDCLTLIAADARRISGKGAS
ncbi:MAG TPA: hypothetical protein VF548_02955 [Allosphingosinicella sp.]|jgi:hypothetical protein